MIPEKIIAMISAERDRQDAKWGSDRRLDWTLWSTILTEEVGEVAEACLDQQFKPHTKHLIALQAELVQVAAVAIAAIEHTEEEIFKNVREWEESQNASRVS